MIWLYRICFFPLFLLACPFYLSRMLKRGGYAKDFKHRFGYFPNLSEPKKTTKRIWVQAVSVGEVLAVKPLIELLMAQGGVEIVLTTTTSTGYQQALSTLSEFCLEIGVFPIDFISFNRRSWNRIKPDVVFLMEGELWPEHIHRAQKRKIPVFLINGRLSDKSFRRYQRFPSLAAKLFSSLDLVLVSSATDASRFRAIGVRDERLKVTGNLKCDKGLKSELSPERFEEWMNAFSFENSELPLLLGSSTWDPEESYLVDFWEKMSKAKKPFNLVLVPRHAERREDIRRMLKKKNLPFYFRSEAENIPQGHHIYVADTTGELSEITLLADLVFIGKSMPPNKGGQSPVESALLKRPMIMGKDMSNFRHISRTLTDSGAALQVNDLSSLEKALETCLFDEDIRRDMSRAAITWSQENQGASQRSLDFLMAYFSS